MIEYNKTLGRLQSITKYNSVATKEKNRQVKRTCWRKYRVDVEEVLSVFLL